jgi:hypothetical protein
MMIVFVNVTTLYQRKIDILAPEVKEVRPPLQTGVAILARE